MGFPREYSSKNIGEKDNHVLNTDFFTLTNLTL